MGESYKKKSNFYGNKLLVFCVFLMMVLCFVGLVHGGFAGVFKTPADGGTIALSNLAGDNYTFVVNVTESITTDVNVSNVTIYRRPSGATAWTAWGLNTSYNITKEINVVVPLNGINALNGSFELNITVNANNSGINSTVITVLIDTIKPIVTLANGTNMNISSNVTLNYQYTASDYNLSTCQMYFGNSTNWVMVKENTSIYSTSITKSVTNTSLRDGTYYFSVYCNDSLGNSLWNNTNTSFTVDATSPVMSNVSLSLPSSYILKRGTTVNITINATDATSGVRNVTVNGLSIGRQSSTSDTWSRKMALTGTSLEVIARDYAGNTYTNNSITLILDDVAPLTTFMNTSTIDEDSWYNRDLHIALYATNGTGGVAGIDKIVYRNGTGGGWTVWSGNLTFGTNLSSNIFQFRANDTLGNVESYHSRIIKIDKVPPKVIIDSLSSKIVGVSENIIVAANVTDNMYGSGINTLTITAWHNGTGGNNESNKASLSLINGKYTGTLEAPSGVGSYFITVNATDIARNSNSTVKSGFAVNTSIPTINANVSNGTYVANLSVIRFTVTNDSHVYYNSSENMVLTVSSENATYIDVTINASNSTTFTLYIHANNTYGAVTNRTYIYRVDNVIPPIAFSGLSANQIVNGTTTITALSNDGASGTSSVTFYIGVANSTLSNVGTDSTSPYVYEWNTLDYTDGNYSLNITAVDYAGNVNSTLIFVTVNNSRPVTQSVSSGTADFGGTILQNTVPQITGLNSSNAVVTARNVPFVGSAPGDLNTVLLYLNVSADTAYNAKVYFGLKTSSVSDRNNIRVYMDHNDDGTYESNTPASYVSSRDSYDHFYFTTTSFSIFAIGPAVSVSGDTGGSTGGGGSSASTYSIGFTSEGAKVGLKVGDKALFSYNKVTQTILATKVTTDFVTLKVTPVGKTVELKKGESANVDLDSDGTYDLKLTLDYVYGNKKAFVIVERISAVKTSYTAFEIIDIIRNFYSGTNTYTAFEIIDVIRAFYGGN
ncbi:hypothetical protein KY366_08170 [Candidatus Woesearchaeota archaeon]|nr:hypothetical protein [Candidatus Woesearchaeota archaeon]